MKETLVLSQQQFFFRIIIPQESEYYGLEGMMSLQRQIPNTIDVIAIKESPPYSKMFCIANNHSDFMGIEGRLGVKTEAI